MRYASHVAAIGWAMAIGFALYVGSILMITDYGSRADMLPFIAHAIDIFLTGRDPYTADFSHITKNPFFYPPAQWLAFLPAQAFGIDLRIVNLLSAAAMVALVEWRARRGEAALRAGVYPIMLSPLTLPMMYTGQIWPYWLATLCLGLLALRGRWAWAALVAAIAIGLRQTALAPTAALAASLIGHLRSVSLLRAFRWAQ